MTFGITVPTHSTVDSPDANESGEAADTSDGGDPADVVNTFAVAPTVEPNVASWR